MQDSMAWNPPPQVLTLPSAEVHIWRTSLDQPLPVVQRWSELLSPEERLKAARFYFDRDRQPWIVAHGVLRALLARYLPSMPTDQLEFAVNDYGKPTLLSSAGTDLRFNLSHSHHLALYAFACGRDLGIDVEYKRLNIEYADIAKYHFSAAEVQALETLPPPQKADGFYACWTRKEAYIKARGMGLSLPLTQFDVSLLPSEPARLLASREAPHDVERWQMLTFDPGQDYAGALVFEGPICPVKSFNW